MTKKKTVTVDQVRSQLSDFLELSHKLEPMEFRQLLQAFIEKIEASKYHLKYVHFSFIVYMPEDTTDP
jgi:site-specific DNA recombinase